MTIPTRNSYESMRHPAVPVSVLRGLLQEWEESVRLPCGTVQNIVANENRQCQADLAALCDAAEKA